MIADVDFFRGLHIPGEPLVALNCWDVASANAIARSHLCVATSSGAIAASRGFRDGQILPLQETITLVANLSAKLTVPLSVDLEAGFSDNPAQVADNVAAVVAAGAAGINLEDGLTADGTRQLIDASKHADKIRAIRSACHADQTDVFINARCDTWLFDDQPESLRLGIAVERSQAYAEAGADGFFAPGLTDLDTIGRLAEQIELPLNVMAQPGAPDLAELARAGVARLSFGGWPFITLQRHLERIAKGISATDTYQLFD